MRSIRRRSLLSVKGEGVGCYRTCLETKVSRRSVLHVHHLFRTAAKMRAKALSFNGCRPAVAIAASASAVWCLRSVTIAAAERTPHSDRIPAFLSVF